MQLAQLPAVLGLVVAIPVISVLCIRICTRAVGWARRNRSTAASLKLELVVDDKLGGFRAWFGEGWEGIRRKLGDWVDSLAESDAGIGDSGGASTWETGDDSAGGDGCD